MCNNFQHWIRSRLAFLCFFFCLLISLVRSTPTTKRKDSNRCSDYPSNCTTFFVLLIFCLFVYISLTRNSHNGDELFVSLYHFFFVFHDVGYTQKIKKDERDFIFFRWLHLHLLASSTHKRSLGLCFFFVNLYRHGPRF